MSYVVSIGASRNIIEKGKAGEALIFGVHFAWFLLALVLVSMEFWQRKWQQWRQPKVIV
jgi:hypothetical protein